jgi:hypothetical protein
MMNDSPYVLQRDPEDTFDQVLRTELFWQASPDLTEHLMALASQEFEPEPDRPQPWYITLVTVLTILAMLLSLGVAWQFYGAVSAELGLTSLWASLQTSVATWLTWLYAELPAAYTLVEAIKIIHDQLHWLIIALVLWLTLDGASPRVTLQQKQLS